ncbi:MAG: sigma-54-dependent transcriptional regulator [Roseinatronobacter sp.]
MKDAVSPAQVLLVEDTASLQLLYRTILTKAGFPPICASTGAEAIRKFSETRPPVVLLDMILPDADGLSVLEELLRLDPDTKVIVITADGSVDRAVQATRKGAHDFLVKPLGDVRLVSSVTSALAVHRAAMRQGQRRDTRKRGLPLAKIAADSAVMQAVLTKLKAVARSDAPVFLIGPLGTGKLTSARLIHDLSARCEKPFVVFDCTLKGHEIFEHGLFGAESLVPAVPGSPPQRSAFEKAQGGTLLLQSPEALSPEHQMRLLAVLRRGSLLRADGTHSAIDLRLLVSSKRDPAHSLRAGQLDEDLYFHLCVLPIHMPLLRDRGPDLKLIAQDFLREIADQEGKRFREISAEALQRLEGHPWPGNLYELRNVLQQAIIHHDGTVLMPDMLTDMVPDLVPVHRSETGESPAQSSPGHHLPPPHPSRPDISAHPAPTSPAPAHDAYSHTFGARNTAVPATRPAAHDPFAGMTLAQIERHVIESALRRHDGSVGKAALELDVAPSTIYRKRESWLDAE